MPETPKQLTPDAETGYMLAQLDLLDILEEDYRGTKASVDLPEKLAHRLEMRRLNRFTVNHTDLR